MIRISANIDEGELLNSALSLISDIKNGTVEPTEDMHLRLRLIKSSLKDYMNREGKWKGPTP